MECKAYQFSREYQRAALLFLANLTEDNIENKENVSIDCVEVIMGALNMLDYPDVTLPALFLVKNITTNIHTDFITDINDHGCVDNVIKSIARYPTYQKIIATSFAVLPNLVAKRAKTKRNLKEGQILIVLTSINSLTNRNVLKDAFTFLLLISKIASVRRTLGVNSVLITFNKLNEHFDFLPLVTLMILFLERTLCTESNIGGINLEDDIGFLLQILAKYPKERTIHLSVNRILRMLADYKEVPEIIFSNGGITTLIHSMNCFSDPIKTFASQTIEFASNANEKDAQAKLGKKGNIPKFGLDQTKEKLSDSEKLYSMILEGRKNKQNSSDNSK